MVTIHDVNGVRFVEENEKEKTPQDVRNLELFEKINFSKSQKIEIVTEGPITTVTFDGPTLKVETLEGDVTVDVNDYIIKGKNGEMIPCQSYLKKMENPYTNAKENEVTTQREFSVINIEDGIEVTKVSSHQTLSTLEKTPNGIKISFEPTKNEDVGLYIGETEIAKVKKGMGR